jgi:hypothetical protein
VEEGQEMCETFYGANRQDDYARALAVGRWVYNNYPGQERLHEAGCTYIGAERPGILNYEKIVCAGEIDCVLETLRSRGLPRRDGGCCPGIPVGGAGANAGRRVPPAANASTRTGSGAIEQGIPSPCRESWIETQVANFLADAGYTLAKQAAGPTGGAIDLVATQAGETLVVEAKGEDKGGYTSAEMNFQMGVGQIASRMTDDSRDYSLAFPFNADFQRVLRRYRGTKAFARLRLGALVVFGPGEVRRYDPDHFTKFVSELT